MAYPLTGINKLASVTRVFALAGTVAIFATACTNVLSTSSGEFASSDADVKATAIEKAQWARHDFPYQSRYAEVEGSSMHYVDTGGDKDPVLLLHGQPTWSYLWRDIIPELEQEHRVIAVDLIGFGKSDKPDINYTAEDHARYLKGFIEELGLQDLTLVIHDWGSFLGFNYASLNPKNVKAIAFMEAIIPYESLNAGADASASEDEPQESPENASVMDDFIAILKQIQTPGVGEKMILEDNFFIEQILLNTPMLSEDEKNAYREPFDGGVSRQPMLQFPRQVSLDGEEPKYVVNGIERYSKYLIDVDIPKLLLTFSPGALIGEGSIRWAKNNLSNLQTVYIGSGVHFVQEDHPEAIGKTINTWMADNEL